MYKLIYSKQAKIDFKKLQHSGLQDAVLNLLSLIKENPYSQRSSYEKLKGELLGALSRRINYQHRLVYQIRDSDKVIRILRMWTHYE